MHIPKSLEPFTYPPLPSRYKKNHRTLSKENEEQLRDSIREHFIPDHVPEGSPADIEAFRESPEGKAIIDEHINSIFFARYVGTPWLGKIRPIKNARILEIGCGTGMSSIAAAEQGAIVTSIDIHEPSLKVARMRAECYGLSVDFRNCNATNIAEQFKGISFDFIVFSASMEHMTLTERMKAMQSSWNMLSEGAVWVIGYTPNRLWYFDGHTSFLPFFHWLPDELALQYLKNSPRKLYSKTASMHDRAAAMEFLIRGGRGVSFHEFALSMNDPEKLIVHSGLDQYIRKNPLRYLVWRLSDKYRYQKILRRAGPKIHQAFYEEGLSFAIIKN